MSVRRLLLTCLSVCFIAGIFGCQSSPKPTTHDAQAIEANAENHYEAATASALVFDPPVIQDEPRLELSRADRQPGVNVGYDENVVETYYIRLDDRQIHNGSGSFGWGGSGGGYSGSYDRYERRPVTERTGVRYR